MSAYIKISTKEYPRYYGDIQLEYPDWNLGDPLPEDWAEVEPTPLPELGPTQIVEDTFAEKINGKWKQGWIVKTFSQEEFDQREKQNALNRVYFALGLPEETLTSINFSPNKIKELDSTIDDIVISLLGE